MQKSFANKEIAMHHKHITTVKNIYYWQKLDQTTTVLLHSFNGLFSRTTLVSWHQKSRTILVKPIWIY